MAKKRSKKQVKERKAAVVSFRAEKPLLGEIDDYLDHLIELNPGGNWTRSSAALNLVVQGLRDWRDKDSSS